LLAGCFLPSARAQEGGSSPVEEKVGTSDGSLAIVEALQDARGRLHKDLAAGVVLVQVVRRDLPMGLLSDLHKIIGGIHLAPWREGALSAEEMALWQGWALSFIEQTKKQLIESGNTAPSAETANWEAFFTKVIDSWIATEDPLRVENSEAFSRYRGLLEPEVKKYSLNIGEKKVPRPQPMVVRQSTGFVVRPGVVVTTQDITGSGHPSEWIRVYSGAQVAFSTGEILGRDPETNVAVVKLASPGADLQPTIDFSKPIPASVGSYVFNLYHAFNQPLSMRTGEVTGTDRTIPFFHCASFIETSFPTCPGTLGSPIVDLHGKLVGMNVVFMSQGSMSEVTFALPASHLKSVVDQIMDAGKVERGCIGVFVDERPDPRGDGTAVWVRSILKDSSAYSGGLREGDYIVSLDGNPVHCRRSLLDALSHFRAHDEVKVQVIRDQEAHDLTISLAPFPPPGLTH
jgi:S1-C subfamily serine protease